MITVVEYLPEPYIEGQKEEKVQQGWLIEMLEWQEIQQKTRLRSVFLSRKHSVVQTLKKLCNLKYKK